VAAGGEGGDGAPPAGGAGGLVLDRHRPTLGDLLAPRPRWVRRAVAAIAALVALALLARVLAPEQRGIEVVVRDAPAFNLAHPAELVREPPAGEEVLRLVRRRGPLFVQSFAVRPLTLPAYRGEVSGILPIAADREWASLERRFARLELVQEGKTRVNEVPGYQLLFRARLGARRLFGRVVLLPEPVAGARRGWTLELLATPAAGVSRAADVGVRGVIKQPYRTFRFGEEAP
jgi:hypothetical protein